MSRTVSAADAAREILARLGAFLLPHGFRRKGQTFTARREDVSLLVNFQRSASSTPETLILTINLGVYSFTLADRRREQNVPKPSPGIWDCQWQQRLGHLLPENTDRWWRVPEDGDAAQVGAELVQALSRHGLPALEEVASTARLRALWDTGISPGLTDKQRRDYLALLG